MENRIVDKAITRLVRYGLETGLVPCEERIYTVNALLEILGKDDFEWDEEEAAGTSLCKTTGMSCSEAGAADVEEDATDVEKGTDLPPLHEILEPLLDYAAEKGLIADNTVTYRDLFDTKLMSALTPRPKTVIDRFKSEYEKSPKDATDFFYSFSKNTGYIRTERIARDIKWTYPSPYGELDITINLSKPEKDPKAIAAAKNAKASGYPKCLLCMENEGYAGRIDHPSRGNHRIIPITVGGEDWGFQYSPYVYYNEHCIVLNTRHVPMKIDEKTFVKLLDFVGQFPHYILGSNADLPIVGGSILAHDHFQGGNYVFPMARAGIERSFRVRGFEDVEAGIVNWPMSVIRIAGREPSRLVALASHILDCWRGYSDEAAGIYAYTCVGSAEDGCEAVPGTAREPHNTITPIARKNGDLFELDLVLRNNLTTPDRPLGLYHPRPEYHHIKKENIGLIEVMGLAILPARLRDEIGHLRQIIEEALENGGDDAVDRLDIRRYEDLEKHAEWFEEIRKKTRFSKADIKQVFRESIGEVFTHVLEDAGVYKTDSEGREAFMRFVAALN